MLENAQNKLNGLTAKLSNYETIFNNIISDTISEYVSLTRSHADVSSIISLENLKKNFCEYDNTKKSIDNRNILGFETPEDNLSLITFNKFETSINSASYIEAFSEIVRKPSLNPEKAELLLNYTIFYKEGIEAFNLLENKICPFCFQKWTDANEEIKKYEAFLNSSFNKKRDSISLLENNINDLLKGIDSINVNINSIKEIVLEEAKKYSIDAISFDSITLNKEFIDKLKNKIKIKLENMESVIDISEELSNMKSDYNSNLASRNQIITEIKNSIKSIKSKRMAANKEVAKYLMNKIWNENKEQIKNYNETVKEIHNIKSEIIDLEKKDLKQDTICQVFNGLIDFLGLSEYQIATDKKLLLRLNKSYDISSEGNRISSAQKKLLSLCYFIAEAISEIHNVSELKKYIFVFDDPVDSADFVYFHSITALIENFENILGKILNKDEIKVGQIIVMTHNSVFYDRLFISFQMRRSLTKIENVSLLEKGGVTVNNYKIYLQYIIRYYKNPQKNRKDMIFIGTLIRRVLEILSNFNNLDNNKFKDDIVSMGKPKLALLANHLSHESFARVLNPFSSEVELKEACGELLDVIRSCHPKQYEHIQNYML